MNVCRWKPYELDNDGYYQEYVSDCGDIESELDVNHWNFCPICGGKIVVEESVYESDE